MPENRWDVWQGLQALGVDLVVQAAEGRRKRLLVADMESTIIENEMLNGEVIRLDGAIRLAPK